MTKLLFKILEKGRLVLLFAFIMVFFFLMKIILTSQYIKQMDLV